MYIAYIMKRTQIYLDEDQDRRLSRRAKASGSTKSTLIREAIDRYLDAPTPEAQRLARFREALDAIAARPIRSLPDGKTYVETIRSADERRQGELDARRG